MQNEKLTYMNIPDCFVILSTGCAAAVAEDDIWAKQVAKSTLEIAACRAKEISK